METNNYVHPDDIIGRECKNVAYSTDAEKRNDFVLIKEVIHTKDGRLVPRLIFRENVQRPFYITRKEFRNHTEKK